VCGIFGIYGHPQAALMTYYGLYALQHRGQESTGIVTCERDELSGKVKFNFHKGLGLVADVFKDEKIINEYLRGTSAIGHNRYSTTGASNKANIQPFVVHYKGGNLAIAHNGNLTNTRTLRNKLQLEGTIFLSFNFLLYPIRFQISSPYHFIVNDKHFTRQNIAHVFCFNQIKSTCF